MHSEAIVVVRDGQANGRLTLSASVKGPAGLAARHLQKVAREQVGCDIELHVATESGRPASVMALCPPWDGKVEALVRGPGVELSSNGKLAALGTAPHGDQGFVATRLDGGERGPLVLAADTEIGLRNALLTLADRLHRDAKGNRVLLLAGSGGQSAHRAHGRAGDCGRLRVYAAGVAALIHASDFCRKRLTSNASN